MELQQQIKELEKKAKDTDYWKDRYMDLRNELVQLTSKINELLVIKNPNKKIFTKQPVWIKMRDELIESIKSGEKQLSTKDFEKRLIKENILGNNYNINRLRSLVKSVDGVHSTFRNKCKFFFWTEPKKENIKFSKVSIMG